MTTRTNLPPRLLPVLYFVVAHAALALAFGAVAFDPRSVSGFFYHSRMLGIVHLVTHGWITASIASLAIASVLGRWLTIAEPSSATLRVAMAYGVFGLVGVQAQMVVGMEGRLLPIFAWSWAYANRGYNGPVPSQHDMAWRSGQELVFVLWLFGVPALAGGLAFDAIPFVRAAAWSLFAATLVDTVNVTRILRHAFLTPSTIDR